MGGDGVQRPIAKQQRRKQPRQRDQPVIDALERLHFHVPQRAPLEPHRQPQREKEKHSDENQDAVQIERRVALARHHKRQRPQQEQRRAVEQLFSERKFRGVGTEPARLANVRVPVGSAIQAARHSSASPQKQNQKEPPEGNPDSNPETSPRNKRQKPNPKPNQKQEMLRSAKRRVKCALFVALFARSSRSAQRQPRGPAAGLPAIPSRIFSSARPCIIPGRQYTSRHGRLAQRLEHPVYTRKAEGSNPSPPTK